MANRELNRLKVVLADMIGCTFMDTTLDEVDKCVIIDRL